MGDLKRLPLRKKDWYLDVDITGGEMRAVGVVHVQRDGRECATPLGSLAQGRCIGCGCEASDGHGQHRTGRPLCSSAPCARPALRRWGIPVKRLLLSLTIVAATASDASAWHSWCTPEIYKAIAKAVEGDSWRALR